MNGLAETFSETEADDIVRNPHKFGMPTFEEFKRNRSKYLGRRDDTFGLIDKGSKNLRRIAQRHIYEIEGYRCKSLEEIERVARDELGIDIDALDYRPHCIPQGGGKCDLLIKFVSKNERQSRENW